MNSPQWFERCNEFFAPLIAPSAVYLALTLLVWSLKVAYDTLYVQTTSSDTLYAEVIANLFGMAQYIILYFICKPHLRRTFCSLVIKGGIISVFFAIYFGNALQIGAAFCGGMLNRHVYTFLFAGSEELAKLATLLVSVKVASIAEPVAPGYAQVSTVRELSSLAFAVGLGFQIVENFLYFQRFNESGMSSDRFIFTAAYRTAFLVHAIYVACSALYLWSSALRDAQKVTFEKFMFSVLGSTLLHYSWNIFASSNLDLGAIPINRVLILVWLLSLGLVFIRLRKSTD